MTGKDLILYILQNDLENEPVFKDGKFIGFNTIEETAVKMGVGTATVSASIKLGQIKSIKIGNTYLVPAFQEVTQTCVN